MSDNTQLNAVSGTPGDLMRDVQKGGSSGPKTPVAIIDVGGSGAENLLAAGQAAMSGSLPVAIASNQSAVPVTASAGVNLNTSLLALEAGGNLASLAGKDFATQATLAALNAKVTACNTGSVVLAAGASVVGAVTQSGAWNVGTVTAVTAISSALPAGTNTLGSVLVASAATGGVSAFRLVSAATTNATSAKASAGTLYGYLAVNTNAAFRFLKLYNKASAPAVGTDTPFLTVPLPPSGGANLAFPPGIAFGAGIAFAVTANMADADGTAVGANEVAVNLFYV